MLDVEWERRPVEGELRKKFKMSKKWGMSWWLVCVWKKAQTTYWKGRNGRIERKANAWNCWLTRKSWLKGRTVYRRIDGRKKSTNWKPMDLKIGFERRKRSENYFIILKWSSAPTQRGLPGEMKWKWFFFSIDMRQYLNIKLGTEDLQPTNRFVILSKKDD